jgi:hypothetical protein
MIEKLHFTVISQKLLVLLPLFASILFLSGCSSYDDNSLLGGEGSVIIRLILVVVGLLYLLAGYAIHEFMIQLTGFIFGGIFGAIVLSNLVEEFQGVMAIVGFIVGGIIGGAIALFLAALGVFVIGALIGTVITVVGFYGNSNGDPPWALFCIGGLVGGFVMLALYKAWIIGVTSILGSVMLGLGIGAPPGYWILFFIVGIAVQYGLTKSLTPAKQPQTTQPSGLAESPSRPAIPPPETNPLAIAKQRLALGEITLEEYERIKPLVTESESSSKPGQ